MKMQFSLISFFLSFLIGCHSSLTPPEELLEKTFLILKNTNTDHLNDTRVHLFQNLLIEKAKEDLNTKESIERVYRNLKNYNRIQGRSVKIISEKMVKDTKKFNARFFSDDDDDEFLKEIKYQLELFGSRMDGKLNLGENFKIDKIADVQVTCLDKNYQICHGGNGVCASNRNVICYFSSLKFLQSISNHKRG